MASQSLSKKRPAPGTSPTPYPSPYPPAPGLTNHGDLNPPIPDDPLLRYGYKQELDSTRIPYHHDAAIQRPNTGRDGHGASNQLARRPTGQVVRRDGGLQESAELRVEGQTGSNTQKLEGAWGDDLNDLKQRAQAAKRDAQSKRKQIPPFVQKLASFLDDGKNTNLIRWSDGGNSFIVEDEDEFAKNLIPELFKHNNYASFVRQLNMYGFHKKVGLSDNSMRASEKRSKSPSEYSNPYFRRGQADLLWLIQKPRNAQSGRVKGSKRTDHDLNEDDIDDYVDDIQMRQETVGSNAPPRLQLAIDQGRGSLPSDQLTNVHQELQTIRQHQTQITAMIQRLKLEHEQLYGQAATFQDQHSRHENSINAILTFLATVYNRSLQGHEGVQGIANLFTGAIPQDSNQSHVLDVGDYDFDQLNGSDGTMQRQLKKQPLLLKAAPADGGRVSTVSPYPNAVVHESRPTRRMSQTSRNEVGQAGNVEELPETTDQPREPRASSQAERQPPNDILSVIQNSNARNSKPGTPAADFSNVLNSLETSGGGSPLTHSQRADMLRLISDQGSPATVGENALTSPNPPPMPNNYDSRLAATQSDIENLAKMQADQDRSVQNLTNLLQPLSPSGSIPGIGDGTDVHPPPLDIDDFLNSTYNYIADLPIENNYDLNDPNAKTQATGINFADFDDGDDELFRGMENNNPTATGSSNGSHNNNNNNNHDPPHYVSDNPYNSNLNLNLDGATNDDDDNHLGGVATGADGGRIESMASSQVTTPITTSADTGDNMGNGSWLNNNAAAAIAPPLRKRRRIS